MKKVLILTGSYLPGKKSAGVTTSLYNMIKDVHSIDFYILTEDRDIGEKEAYIDVKLEEWTKYENANVFYSRKYIMSMLKFRQIILSQSFDIYYINGFYNIKDNLRFFILYFFRLIPRKKIVIAPRGIFSMGEYNNREILRYIYRTVFKLSRLSKSVYWHATSILEKNDIIKYFKNAEYRISVIPNLSGISIGNNISNKLCKSKGEIRILFISRISEKKNIKFILETLKSVTGNIKFDIYGMIGTTDDKNYFDQCLNMMKELPSNVECQYYGTIDHEKVPELYKKHHLFFFPTFGENYGHVIAESLAYGCPLLLSDTTPWNMINDYGAGWVINLKDKSLFKEKLQECINMNQLEWEKLSINAIKVAKDYIDNNNISLKYKEFFQNL